MAEHKKCPRNLDCSPPEDCDCMELGWRAEASEGRAVPRGEWIAFAESAFPNSRSLTPEESREFDASVEKHYAPVPISPPSPAETPPNVGRATRQFERKMLSVDRSRDPLEGAHHIATVVYDDEAGTISVEPAPTETQTATPDTRHSDALAAIARTVSVTPSDDPETTADEIIRAIVGLRQTATPDAKEIERRLHDASGKLYELADTWPTKEREEAFDEAYCVLDEAITAAVNCIRQFGSPRAAQPATTEMVESIIALLVGGPTVEASTKPLALRITQAIPLIRRLATSTPSPTTPSAPTIRHDVRFDEGQVEPDGTIDEVVGTGIYHAEMMNDNTLWMQLGDDAFHVTSRGKRLRFTRWGPAGDMARAVRATSPDPRTSPPEPR